MTAPTVDQESQWQKPRVLLLGAGGQLGMLLARGLAPEFKLVTFNRTELDFTDEEALRQAVRITKPHIVVNAAAYTAVDRAEKEPELARQVNGVAPGIIADELKRTDGWLIHYSTDYVFDGSGSAPWRETDATGPLSVYGQTKLDGELAIAASGCRHLIFRTSWVYAAQGRNFLHTMLRLGKERERLEIVDDQIGAPTSAEAITEATLVVLRKLAAQSDVPNPAGVLHLTCAGETSWYGFAKAIFAAFASQQKPPEVAPIPSEAYFTPAARPRNSRLCCDQFTAQFGHQMPTWEAALRDVAATIRL